MLLCNPQTAQVNITAEGGDANAVRGALQVALDTLDRQNGGPPAAAPSLVAAQPRKPNIREVILPSNGQNGATA